MKAKLASEPKFAKMKLVQVAFGEESEQVNQQQALALAQAFPDLKGIIVPSGLGLPAAARALEQAKLIDKIKLTGLAPASFMTKYIKAGQSEDIWWNVQDLGYLTYYAAQAYAQCKLTGKEGETFKAGRLGDYTVGADGTRSLRNDSGRPGVEQITCVVPEIKPSNVDLPTPSGPTRPIVLPMGKAKLTASRATILP